MSTPSLPAAMVHIPIYILVTVTYAIYACIRVAHYNEL
jgi:hypothetical protein